MFISVYELWWRFAALGDELQREEQRDPTLARSHKLRDFLLSDREEDQQLDTEVDEQHPAQDKATPAALRRPSTTVSAWPQPPAADHNADIVVDTAGPVVNPHPFNYIINCPDLCRGVDVFLLSYVHTSVDHFSRRARIRKTWALPSHYHNFTMRTVFFVGLTDKAAWLQDALEHEATRYNDIVQDDFLDTYRYVMVRPPHSHDVPNNATHHHLRLFAQRVKQINTGLDETKSGA